VGPAIVVPIKSFDLAKGRLSDALSPTERAMLAKQMASTVLAARNGLPMWVICDDHAVAAFAVRHGVGVLWRASAGLNAAVRDGTAFAASKGHDRVIIAHADLPLATDLRWVGDTEGVTIVPDRRGDGTNVMCVPTNVGFSFHYGTGSASAHQAEAERLGLELRVVPDEQLGWDVDVPEDLAVIDLTDGGFDDGEFHEGDPS